MKTDFRNYLLFFRTAKDSNIFRDMNIFCMIYITFSMLDCYDFNKSFIKIKVITVIKFWNKMHKIKLQSCNFLLHSQKFSHIFVFIWQMLFVVHTYHVLLVWGLCFFVFVFCFVLFFLYIYKKTFCLWKGKCFFSVNGMTKYLIQVFFILKGYRTVIFFLFLTKEKNVMYIELYLQITPIWVKQIQRKQQTFI